MNEEHFIYEDVSLSATTVQVIDAIAKEKKLIIKFKILCSEDKAAIDAQYDGFSDVVESCVAFASKNLTHHRMHLTGCKHLRYFKCLHFAAITLKY